MNASNRRLAHACAAAFLAAGLAACGERISESTVKAPKPIAPSPSAVVIGQVPAEPTGDPAGTAPVASGTTEVSKATESRKKPQEGDGDSHSTLDPKSPMKAGAADPAQPGSTK